MTDRVMEDGPSAGQDLDDLDDALFGYGFDADDARAIELSAAANREGDSGRRHGTSTAAGGADDGGLGLGLGLDQEVKVRAQRQPVAKLDEPRLLSAAGIPKLQRLARSGDRRFALKNKKGHEFNDVARLLEMYQLWLDDLYPRAKFADAVAIVEKLGHSKRMQMLRRDWINEGKPKDSSSLDDDDGTRLSGDSQKIDEDPFAALADAESTAVAQAAESAADGDDGGLFVANSHAAPQPAASGHNEDANIEDDVPMDDDLDALLAEDSSDHFAGAAAQLQQLHQPQTSSPHTSGQQQATAATGATSYEEEHADDIKAMRDMW